MALQSLAVVLARAEAEAAPPDLQVGTRSRLDRLPDQALAPLEPLVLEPLALDQPLVEEQIQLLFLRRRLQSLLPSHSCSTE